MSGRKWQVIVAIAIVILAAIAILHPNDTEQPNYEACREAMELQIIQALSNPDAPEQTRPEKCKGISDAELERIAYEILGGPRE